MPLNDRVRAFFLPLLAVGFIASTVGTTTLGLYSAGLASHERTLDREIELTKERLELEREKNSYLHSRSLEDRKATKDQQATNTRRIVDLEDAVKALKAELDRLKGAQ